QTDRVLAQVAGLGGSAPSPAGEPFSMPRSTRDFWRQEPARFGKDASKEDEEEGGERATRKAAEGPPQTFHGVQLVEGASLLLASSRRLDERDLEAIRTAAAPLIDTLTRRQLIPIREEGEPP